MTPRIVAFTKDWDDVPTCTTHVLREMGKSMPVLWVNSIGTRRPSLASARDLRRVVQRVRGLLRRSDVKENRLSVLSPVLVPKAEGAAARAVNALLFRAVAARELHAMGRGPVEYWAFVPNAVDLVPPRRRGAGARVVYYCVDDWTKFGNVDGAWMAEKEAEMLRRADIVFTPARYLEERCRRLAACPVHYVPHGVSHAKFAAALTGAVAVPADLAALGRPLVGFYGNILPWVDFDLVAELAARRPSWRFALIGQVYCDVGRFDRVPNVRFLGRREHDQLPAYCKGFDAAMIPYDLRDSRMESVNPVKTLELLAAGVPIAAADVPELRKFGDRVRICRGVEEWLAGIEAQMRRTDRRAISDGVAGDDWSARVRDIRRLVEEAAD
jgi:glycosyltransferase involved in cell wall biosynthesis